MSNKYRKRFNYYGILRGSRNNVVTSSWRECLELIKDCDNPAYKGFKTMVEAEKYAKSVKKFSAGEKETGINIKKGYNLKAFKRGYDDHKKGKSSSDNPFKNLNSRFEMDKICWDMGYKNHEQETLSRDY